MLSALSPLDGRYGKIVEPLQDFFSEQALLGARVEVELRYFIALSAEPKVKELPPVSRRQAVSLVRLIEEFDAREAMTVKQIEAVTNHDVKAVEYYLKTRMERMPGLKPYTEFVHFGLTSEDVNNLAYGILTHRALALTVLPALKSLWRELSRMAAAWKDVPMLSLTHGQPATPTAVGKELLVFVSRLERQWNALKAFRMNGKLGGAVGNFSAHRAAYPDVNWEAFRSRFVRSLGLAPLMHTTQINPHDDVAELSHLLFRINTILLNLSRDMWMYISRGVFRQTVKEGEIGSSTMPHKVNPIQFENAEGNIGLSNALFHYFAEKLPVSRLQRDLSDSTVQRSLGTAFGYHLLAVQSLLKGLARLSLDRDVLTFELDAHPEVHAEAIQTVLRKHGVKGAYETLKSLTRRKKVTREGLRTFVEGAKIPKADRERLLKMLG